MCIFRYYSRPTVCSSRSTVRSYAAMNFDGAHTYNRWSFSYTRLNIHLAAAAAASGGCILIDSTRTGKRFPDSFTATVG